MSAVSWKNLKILKNVFGYDTLFVLASVMESLLENLTDYDSCFEQFKCNESAIVSKTNPCASHWTTGLIFWKCHSHIEFLHLFKAFGNHRSDIFLFSKLCTHVNCVWSRTPDYLLSVRIYPLEYLVWTCSGHHDGAVPKGTHTPTQFCFFVLGLAAKLNSCQPTRSTRLTP